jgi:phospholipid transport system transporter-binding protein
MSAAENVLRVTGRLTIDMAAGWFSKGLPVTGGSSELLVDLSQIEVVDSSAVSLMLVWLREAQRSQVDISFVHVPDDLLSLAKLYGVADVLQSHVKI